MHRKMTQSQKSLANVCLFCGEGLKAPSMCTYCGFKFCDEHKSPNDHQCIKTRYSEYIRKSLGAQPNVSKGKFIIVCEVCGFNTKKGLPIEYAGEELIQHTQLVGCSDKVFLDEVIDHDGNLPIESVTGDGKTKDSIQHPKTVSSSNNTTSTQTSIVEDIIKLSALKEKGMISEQEFLYIKNELIKKML